MPVRRSTMVAVVASAALALVVAAVVVATVVVPGPAARGIGRQVPAARPAAQAPAVGVASTSDRAAALRRRRRLDDLAWARLPKTGWIATLRDATTWSVHPGSAAAGHLAARNPYGTRMVLALVGAPDIDGWAHVELPIRPNGSTGWIRWRDASLARTDYRVQVDLTTRTLEVLDGARRVLTTPVAVGTPRTPTPTGSTYLWELVRPGNPRGSYGPYVFGLALYSDAYAVFNGGEAQIGIHGSDEPASIGLAASNGCVRLPNSVVAHLTGLLPLGTPVTISD